MIATQVMAMLNVGAQQLGGFCKGMELARVGSDKFEPNRSSLMTANIFVVLYA